MNTIRAAREKGKYVVLAGCVPQAAPKLPDLQGLSIIGVQQIDKVVEVVEETLRGHTVKAMGMKKQQKVKLGGAALDLPKIRKNPLVEIIPINTGCLNQCTYCKTKHARGQLGSYTVEEIVARARHVVENEGVKEIWITSEDTGAYGRDIGTSLPELMWALLEVLPDPVMVRLGMTNPPYIVEHLEVRFLHHPFFSPPPRLPSSRIVCRSGNVQDIQTPKNVFVFALPGAERFGQGFGRHEAGVHSL